MSQKENYDNNPQAIKDVTENQIMWKDPSILYDNKNQRVPERIIGFIKNLYSKTNNILTSIFGASTLH